MPTRIRRWGNSLALRIPKALADELGWRDGAEVQAATAGDRLIVRGVAVSAPSLSDLTAEITEYNMHTSPRADGGAAAPPPGRGDLVWLDAPTAGGRMPYLIVSPLAYNARTGMALACPVARRIKGYPFEVVLKVGGRTAGAVLADRVEAVDWRARRAERADTAPAAVMQAVSARLAALLAAPGPSNRD